MTIADLAPTTFSIPTLETDRTFLRAMREDDIVEEIAFFRTERSQSVGGPLPEAQVWRAVAGMIGHWALRGYGFWALEEKSTGRYLGRAGLWNPHPWPEPEIGWTLMAHAEGQGFRPRGGARRACASPTTASAGPPRSRSSWPATPAPKASPAGSARGPRANTCTRPSAR